MGHPDFTGEDKRRLSQLQKIANEMLDEALKDPRLKRWEQLLFVCGGLAFVCIFFLPTGRGESNWVSYLFFLLTPAGFTLLLLLIRWKGQIQDRVEKEFFSRHEAEYKALAKRRDAAEKDNVGDWWR